jgi:hypothetical protein
MQALVAGREAVSEEGFLVWRWAPNPMSSLLQEVTGYGENEYQA